MYKMAENIDEKMAVDPVFDPLMQKLKDMDHWDPFKMVAWSQMNASSLTITRIKRDITNIFQDPLPYIFILPDDDDMSKLHAVISGPDGTPYRGGFFHFFIRFPPEYPIKPLKVKIMTTNKNQVRFNPNLYANGKVCLSILGTWSGPQWSASQSLSSVLVSIQSLMNEKPYHNEPGFHEERHNGDSERYNNTLTYLTLKVAVLDMVEHNTSNLPIPLHFNVQQLFLENIGYYKDVINDHVHLDGQLLFDPFSSVTGNFDFKGLLTRLNLLRQKLSE